MERERRLVERREVVKRKEVGGKKGGWRGRRGWRGEEVSGAWLAGVDEGWWREREVGEVGMKEERMEGSWKGSQGGFGEGEDEGRLLVVESREG